MSAEFCVCHGYHMILPFVHVWWINGYDFVSGLTQQSCASSCKPDTKSFVAGTSVCLQLRFEIIPLRFYISHKAATIIFSLILFIFFYLIFTFNFVFVLFLLQIRRVSFVRQAVKYMLMAKYSEAIGLILRYSDTARRQFLQVLTRFVRQEMLQYIKKYKYSTQALTMEELERFSWKNFLQETRYNLPIIHAVIDAMATPRSRKDRVQV